MNTKNEIAGKKKKYFIPILISTLLILFSGISGCFYLFVIRKISHSGLKVFLSILVILFSVLFIVMMVMVLITRIKELKEEKTDDYSKY